MARLQGVQMQHDAAAGKGALDQAEADRVAADKARAVRALKDIIQAQANEISDAGATCAGLRASAAETTQQNQDLQSELQKRDEKVHLQQEQHGKLCMQLKQLRASAAETKQHKQDLQSELQKRDEKVHLQQDQHGKLCMQLEQLRASAAETKQHNQDLHLELQERNDKVRLQQQEATPAARPAAARFGAKSKEVSGTSKLPHLA